MKCYDLLYERQYFDLFLDYFNRVYSQRESRYKRLIARYRSNTSQLANLMTDHTHVDDIYQCLGREFGMAKRGAKLVTFQEFLESLEEHNESLAALATCRMDQISPDRIPESTLSNLRRLFEGLKIVPGTQKSKLVAVSKTLHFLLPDLVMPIDTAIVLRSFAKREVPRDAGKQYDLFMKVFRSYLDLTDKLGLQQSNGDGRWWNMSVPKRIDNALAGIWGVFSYGHIEYLMCHHTDVLLDCLKDQLSSPSRSQKVKWEDVRPLVQAHPFEFAKSMTKVGWTRVKTYNHMIKAGLAPDEADRILSSVYSNGER